MPSVSKPHFTANSPSAGTSAEQERSRPHWDGDLQRSRLRGFARLKAILWRRSLWLYQTYCLHGTEWYWPLLRALRAGPSQGHLFSRARVKTAADTFGETPILTTVRLLQAIESVYGPLPSPFVDLGCGRGVTCLTAASLGYASVGLEQEADWTVAAQKVADQLTLPAHFQAADLRTAEWPEGGTFLAVATAFPAEMREEILGRWLVQPRDRSLFVTVDWELPVQQFERLWGSRLPVDWGTAQFALWSLRNP